MLRLAVARLAAQWRGMVTVIVGTLLAAMVAAAMPLYTVAVTQIGMVQRLDDRPPQDVNILIRTGLPANATENHSTLDGVVRATLPESFGEFGDWQNHVVAFTETSELFVLVDGVEHSGFKAKLAAYDGIDAGIQWEGRAPQTTADGTVEVGLSEYVAAQLGVSIGDTITLDQRGWVTSKPFDVRISGILHPVTDADWLPLPSLRAEPDAVFFMTRETVQQAAADYLPDTRVFVGWWALFDHAALTYTDLDAAANAADGYEEQVTDALTATLGAASTGIVVQTKLPAALSSAVTDISALGAPFVLLLLQLSALVFYFLVVMGALVRRGERRELSVLQTRGAYRRQIMIVRGLEALLICTGAALAAPSLARLFLSAFIPLITGIERLPLALTPETYVFSAGAALAALAVLLLTLWPPLNLPLIAAGGSAGRSGAAAFFQRYYLDVLLLLIGLIALGQLSARQGQTVETDPVLLLVPTLLFFAMSSLSLRLFPPLMNVLASLLSRSRALTGALAGWQVSREPLHYARITLMLALAVSVGWFGISYQRTVEYNRLDQAAYTSGADVRLKYDTRRAATLPGPALIAAQPDTAVVGRAVRLDGISLAPAGTVSLDTGTLLGVEPDAFAQILTWRDDLGPLPLPQSGSLADYGRTLPDGTSSISFEAQVSRNRGMEYQTATPAEVLVNEIRLSALIIDANGQQAVVPFIPTLDEETVAEIGINAFNAEYNEAILERLYALTWIRYNADLSALMPPLSLKAISVENGQGNQNYFTGGTVLGLRDFRLTADDNETSTGWLAEPAWSPVSFINVDIGGQPAELQAPNGSELSVGFAHPQSAARGSWAIYFDGAEFAAQVAQGPEPDGFALPALLSPRYAAQQRLETGQKFSLGINQTDVWFVVQGIAPYFPTLVDAEDFYIVTDYAGLTRWLEARPRSVIYGNELWIDLTDGTSGETWLNELSGIPEAAGYQSVVTRDAVLETLQTDLLTTGLIGLLLLSFVIALALCAVSFATYAGITLQSRRAEFAVLRALGWPRRQIVVSILAEQTLVMVVGVALGLGIGIFLSAQVLPALSGSDTANVLPYTVRADPDGLGVYILLMAALLTFQLVLGALVIGRQTAETLRAGGAE